MQKAAGTAISPAHQVVDLKFTAIQEKLATNGTLRARARVTEKSTDPCTISPESQYRGAENQLYRVEIHKGGVAWKGTPDNAGNAVEAATFKWSRDNGSVIFPILTLADDTIKLASLGRDKRQSLKIGDWVEIVDDADALRGEAGPLLQVKDIKPDEMVITLSASANRTYKENDSRHPLLRRWDQPDSNGNLAESALLLKEDKGEDDKNWIALEDGVQIQFTPPPPGSSNTYRAGDYWLIPARVATGDVLWPKQNKPTGEVDTYPSGNPIPATLSPHGVEHNYAPLAVVDVGGDGTITPVTDLRRTFTPLAL